MRLPERIISFGENISTIRYDFLSQQKRDPELPIRGSIRISKLRKRKSDIHLSGRKQFCKTEVCIINLTNPMSKRKVVKVRTVFYRDQELSLKSHRIRRS